MQVALRENKIISKKSPDVLLYQSDTAPGSSGSPVFNDQWQVETSHPLKQRCYLDKHFENVEPLIPTCRQQ